ncbi:two-component system, OmpR family, sensor histidine kinase MprB [Sulfobacillus thermosulfidooxidans DSM 9293]|uniref:histidine kinase n=1 Tax=Sulfobacillus thermosulfidooxidans (strain DSM 9293 / VKM B-1269 / AT-1) TaxID=929705 RepID=A0A1W1W9U3_SULTA|nr:HAMP domain-containing sensor histidine kinase [Sulfobacillus thermosulfidooxidans]SMC03054.1 two-component system, OmpR family, sensor histidine kinase MprB [Sulfobacillus thermosulfidooxidans DSM 9293]
MNFPRSLRTRFTIQTGGAIVSLVVVFAIITILAVSFHLYDAAASDALSVYAGLKQAHGNTLSVIVHEYTRSVDPHIWILQHGHVILRSPNTAPRPIGPLIGGLAREPISLRLVEYHADLTYVIDWPLKPDLDLLGDLVLVMTIVGIAAAAGGVLLGRWTTHRVLEPVKRMTRSVEHMLSTNQFLPVENPSRTDDEFSQLARLLSELVQTLEARWQRDRTLLADAAHQLRTPLEVIRGNLDILRNWDSIDRATEEDSLTAMDRAVSEMITLVGDLLTLEHVRNEGPAQLQKHSLRTLLEDASEDARALNPSLHILLHDPGQAAVLIHEPFARRALWAVLENAVKYSPDGGTIEITVLPQGERCGIAIRDHGPGIPEEDIPHIFTRFYRGQNGRGKSGTGLGLSIAEALMRSQKGYITLETGEEGTTFTLWFLRAPASST